MNGAVGRLGSQSFLNGGNFQVGGEHRGGLGGFERGKAFIFSFAQIDDATLKISGLGKRFGEEEIEASAIVDGAILKNGTGPRTILFEIVRINDERLAEGSQRLIVLFIFVVGVR